MNKEQYKKLQPYEQQFRTAVECNYARNLTTSTLATMASVYEEIFGHKSKLGNGCGGCQLKDIKALGKEYLEYKKKQAALMEKARKNKQEKPKELENGNQEEK